MPANVDKAIYDTIITTMKEIVLAGHSEALYLFNKDGLVIAQYDRRQVLAELDATELSVLMYKVKPVVKYIGNLGQIKEITVEDDFGKRLIFRFFFFFGQAAILLLVVPPRKSYRGVCNDFLHTLEQLETSDD